MPCGCHRGSCERSVKGSIITICNGENREVPEGLRRLVRRWAELGPQMTVLHAPGATSITNDNNRELPAMHIMRLQCSRKRGPHGD